MYNYFVTVSSSLFRCACIPGENSPMFLLNQVKAINYDLLLINLLTNLPVLSLISSFRDRMNCLTFKC